MLNPGDRNNVSAVLQVSVAANGQLFEKIRRSLGMCDALRELMKEDILQAQLEGERRGERRGILEGERKGKREGVLESLSHVMESFSVDADKAMEALHIPAEERELYRSKLQ